jgi:hypothetical protein
MRGKPIRFSLARRTVIDLLHFAAAVPTIPVQRRMSLGPLLAARAACRERPRWTAIFTKAYALVAREIPDLRRAYIGGPWPHLYEYPTSKANIVIEREYKGERCPFSILIKNPAGRSLPALGRLLHHATIAPVGEVENFRRALRIAVLPRPLRRLLWWLGLNIGMGRGHFFGTFMLSVYSALDAESLHPLSPLTTVLNYGVINAEGMVDVRIIYDHRVMNGANVARALARLEEILNTVLLEELRLLAEDQNSTIQT